MTDLKSRADELIVNAEMAAMTVTDSPSLSAERDADESHAALTRFVHALCEAADKVGKSRTWTQHHSNCALIQVFGKCDCGLSEFRPELESALSALEKGEKA